MLRNEDKENIKKFKKIRKMLHTRKKKESFCIIAMVPYTSGNVSQQNLHRYMT